MLKALELPLLFRIVQNYRMGIGNGKCYSGSDTIGSLDFVVLTTFNACHNAAIFSTLCASHVYFQCVLIAEKNYVVLNLAFLLLWPTTISKADSPIYELK